MKNIHLLLTGESYLSLNCSYRDSAIGTQVGKPYWTYSKDWKHHMSVTDASVRPHNIYITNDEEIKDGDYYLYLKDNSVQQFIKKHHTKLLALDIQKKIILTTDQDLVKDGVQAIDDEFLEWFVKNPSCEEIYVNKIESFDFKMDKYVYDYKIIIPKEEPKQETLEEVAERLYPTTIDSFTDTGIDMSETERLIFINGAKWQQEQNKNKYSEEEIRNIAEASFSFYRTNEFSDDELEVEWKNWLEKRIQQLKNK